MKKLAFLLLLGSLATMVACFGGKTSDVSLESSSAQESVGSVLESVPLSSIEQESISTPPTSTDTQSSSAHDESSSDETSSSEEISSVEDSSSTEESSSIENSVSSSEEDSSSIEESSSMEDSSSEEDSSLESSSSSQGGVELPEVSLP